MSYYSALAEAPVWRSLRRAMSLTLASIVKTSIHSCVTRFEEGKTRKKCAACGVGGSFGLLPLPGRLGRAALSNTAPFFRGAAPLTLHPSPPPRPFPDPPIPPPSPRQIHGLCD